MPEYYLHAVIVDKAAGLSEAKKIARKTMNRKRLRSIRMDTDAYSFKHIPKNYFKPHTFRKQKIDETTTVVFGELKSPAEVETNGAYSGTDEGALDEDAGSEEKEE